jgi:hypothetical protein
MATLVLATSQVQKQSGFHLPASQLDVEVRPCRNGMAMELAMELARLLGVLRVMVKSDTRTVTR